MRSTTTEARFDPDRILVVDDSPDILSVTDAILSACGYKVVTASSGILALQIIQVMQPALLVLDVNMPGMDGYEVTRQIRSNPDWHSVPILLFTALPKSEASIGLGFGANDIMGKPVKVDEMLSKVSNLILSSQHQLLQAS